MIHCLQRRLPRNSCVNLTQRIQFDQTQIRFWGLLPCLNRRTAKLSFNVPDTWII